MVGKRAEATKQYKQVTWSPLSIKVALIQVIENNELHLETAILPYSFLSKYPKVGREWRGTCKPCARIHHHHYHHHNQKVCNYSTSRIPLFLFLFIFLLPFPLPSAQTDGNRCSGPKGIKSHESSTMPYLLVLESWNPGHEEPCDRQCIN